MRIHRPVTQRQSWWLLATALSAIAPLIQQLPVWLAGGVLATLAVRAWISYRQWRLPTRWLLVPLTLAAAGLVLWHYRTLFGRTPGVALLSVFLALKLLELRVARDALAVVLLSYFLVLAHFMFDQSIPAGLMAAGTVLITTATLAAASDDRPAPTWLIRRSGIMLLQGLPFMVVLFVLFPRIDGPLWGLPQDRFSATSGLSDSMAPGTIAQMSQSDAVAFRVQFAGVVPPQNQLYWRGPVMSNFDGRTWRVENRGIVRDKPPYAIDADDKTAVNYEVTLEPHGQHWLFALEMPANLPPLANNVSGLTGDMQIVSREPIRTRVRYQQTSVPDTRFGQQPTAGEIRAALALPKEGNPKAREVALGWRAKVSPGGMASPSGTASPSETAPGLAATPNEQILAMAEEFFLRQLLAYTLTPPLLGSDAVDEFLFESKQGFCEHFASAFVFAMRAAGVPARVVAGYQGGEINPVDGFLVVRQYDAHAWAEVWLEKRGWVRIDPTAITAPRRIIDNFAAAAPDGAALPLMARADLAWLRELRDRVDAIANGWNQFVLGYNAARQREFLQNLGIGEPDWQRMTAILASLCGTMMLILTTWILWQRQHIDPARAQWLRFTRKLGKRGIHWQPWEGPMDFAARASSHCPEVAESITRIAAQYARLRYGKLASGEELNALKAAIRVF